MSEEEEKVLMDSQNRDAAWKVVGKICAVLSVFLYSIVVFNAQLVVTT